MEEISILSIRIDTDMKRQCESLFGELGMDVRTAISIFLRHSLRVGGFPFDVRVCAPEKETVASVLASRRSAGRRTEEMVSSFPAEEDDDLESILRHPGWGNAVGTRHIQHAI